MTRAGRRGTVGFVLLALAAAAIAARARYSADLSAFLPAHPSATQRALIEQLRSGPAARLIIAAIGGAECRHARAGVRAAGPGAAGGPAVCEHQQRGRRDARAGP